MLFRGWPKDKLAQFCFNTDGPYWEVCDNYYGVSDKAALRSFFTLRPAARDDFSHWTAGGGSKGKSLQRNALFSLARHLVWSSGLWRGKAFYGWLDALSPKIVVIQSGDTAFTHNLARKIARRYDAKLVFFNTEGTYFLKKNFLYKGPLDCIFFPIYRRIYRKAYRRAMQAASYCVYHHEMIKRDNDRVFNVPGCVIHTSTEVKTSSRPFDTEHPVISYFGNFAYGRDEALIEAGSFLQKLPGKPVIRVFGKADETQASRLTQADGIDYRGFIPYEDVVKEMDSSDILLHMESQDEYYAENLRYGFSTKIADSLASGKPFVVYSSPGIACAEYLSKNECALVTWDEATFTDAIRAVIEDRETRERLVERGLAVVSSNHNGKKNTAKFHEALLSLIKT